MPSASKSILFFTPFGYWQVHNQLDLTIASAAKARGLRTTYVTCDAFYQPCSMERGQIGCVECRESMSEISSAFPISGEPFGALLTSNEIDAAETWARRLDEDALVAATYDGLPIGDWALSTVMTHFRIGNIADLGRSAIAKVHRRFLRDTLLTYWAIDRVIDRDGIDAAVIFNGRFYPYRAAFEALRKRDVRVLIHERGRTANSFGFFENEGCLSTRTADSLIADWADTPLDAHQLEQVGHHFSALRLGRSPNWPSFYDRMQSGDPRSCLDIPRGATIVGFFSSSSDEIAGQINFAKVSSQFKLIEDIAEILAEKGAYLVVRHHPHIGGGPVGSPVESSAFFEAYRRTRSRRPNVRVLMPKDELTSYALFPYLRAAIAPFTSLGLETTAFGIPTLVSRGSISEFHPSYTTGDWSAGPLAEKIAFLMSAEASLGPDQLRTFYRTFYSRFFRFSMRLRSVSIKDYVKPCVHPDVAELIEPGRDQALDRLMKFLTTGDLVHERPEARDTLSKEQDATAEDVFIRGELAEIEGRHRSQDRPAPDPTAENAENAVALLCEASSAETAALTARLRELPNDDRLSIISFDPKPLKGLRRVLNLFRSTDRLEFEAWSRGVQSVLCDLTERRVMVISERHQLHDASIATIIKTLERATPANGQMVTLAGWFGGTDDLRPQRVAASSLTMHAWREMLDQRAETLRGQDLLALGLVDKEWLRANLASVDQLQVAFFEGAANSRRSDSEAPVFLWE